MNFNRVVALAVCGLSMLLGSCGPRVQPDQLGTVVTDPAKLPGAGKPYPLPELDKRPAAEKATPQAPALPEPAEGQKDNPKAN